ncbi:MAG: hypothetical protein R3C61_02200 [Bacteroidia bacterium]
MQFPLKDILTLRQSLADEAEISLPFTLSKCSILSQVIEQAIPGPPEISQRYLYEYLHLRINRAEDAEQTTYGLNAAYVEKLVQYVGFQGIQHWLTAQEGLKDRFYRQLESLTGIYDCYVRCNSGQPDLLKSPVRIYHNGKYTEMEMRGKVRTFTGKPEIVQGCMFALLRSDQDKQFHWVCKVGNSLSPEVIQYIFSGISSGGDPIGGKGLLIKTAHSDIRKCTNEKISLESLSSGTNERDRLLYAYFSNTNTTRLKISGVSTFDFRDLNAL